MKSPKYKHDCSDCRFHGTVVHQGTTYDLYSHKNENYYSIIARYGSCGQEYTSVPSFLKPLEDVISFHPYMRKVAVELGLL